LAKEACKILGAHEPEFARFPDNRCDQIPLLDIIKKIEQVIQRIKPKIVYTHNGSDLNIDHVLTFKAVLTACRPVAGASVKKIYAFETLSSTEWSPLGIATPFYPTRFVDIAAFEDIKMKALTVYASEMKAFPDARSLEAVKALGRLRGAQVGVLAAEAFVLIREVE
jgi:LmbE family N-acetylglucosaminyl deacetylase